MIEFADAGALYYSGGVGNLRATAPSAGAKPQKFNANSADAQSYRTWVRERQGEYLASMAAQLGHAIEVTHSYEITHSGVAAKLTAEEASAIAKLPGVKSIKEEVIETLDTFRGPLFIGADTVWNLAVPGG